MTLEAADDFLLAGHEDALWELFHENSKTSRYERHPTFLLHPTDAAIVQVMNGLRRVKAFTDRPKVALPTDVPAASRPFDEVLRTRESARGFSPGPIGLDELAKLLYLGYGVTRDNAGTTFPRPFRAVPSGGALYPLEVYVQATRVEGLEPGLYHYDPEDLSLDVLRLGEDAATIAAAFVQSDLVLEAAAVWFISAVFYRSTFKYGDRAYRFVFLEAGHLAQNAMLTAHELGLATASIGGYMDREVDRYLGLDGLNESTIYTLLVGRA